MTSTAHLSGLQDPRRAHGAVAGSLLLLWAFALPLFPGLAAAFTILAVGAVFVFHRKNLRWKMPSPQSPLFWAMAFYLLHVLGMLWSSNTAFGLFDLQIKAPLFVLPLVLCFLPGSARSGATGMLFLFSIGCAFSVVWKAAMVVLRIVRDPMLTPSQEIFSSAFSSPMHPSYMALYLCVAIAAWYLTPAHRALPRWVSTVVFLWLAVGVVFCASKLGWSVLALLLPSMLLLRWKQKEVRAVLVGAMIVSAALSAGLLAYSPYARDRVQEMWRAAGEEQHDAQANTSSTVRWHTWQAAIDLFKEHPVIGTGTGDIKDELMRLYNERGITYAQEHRLNAHSQYLQSAACLGIGALVCLILMLSAPMAMGRAVGAVIPVAFGILAANCIVESMMEVQAGVLFVSWLLFVLYLDPRSVASPASSPPQ